MSQDSTPKYIHQIIENYYSNTCTCMFIVTLFTIVKKVETTHMPINGWIDEQIVIHTHKHRITITEYYVFIERNQFI